MNNSIDKGGAEILSSALILLKVLNTLQVDL